MLLGTKISESKKLYGYAAAAWARSSVAYQYARLKTSEEGK